MTIAWTNFGVDLHVDTASGAPRASLENGLRTAVQTRRLVAGTRLPSTRTLAADLGVARGTVVAVYDQLVAEGYLVSRPGAGTMVADLGPVPAPAPVPRRPGRAPLDLRPGTPDVASFPLAAWTRCTRRALSHASPSVFGYGDVRGRIELRTALAAYLGRARGVQAVPEQIMITSGATQALALVAGALVASGRVIGMEDPGFAMHRPVVTQAGHRVVSIPVDDRGLCTESLAAGERLAGVVVTPAHQYPTGVTLHPSRRRALTAWAREANALIVEDDYDGEFRYERQPIGALQGTAPDQVIYVGTASKTLAPGLRLGWLVAPERLIAPLTRVKLRTDLSAPTITQLTLAEMITSHGYDRHIRTMRLRYRRRRDLLRQALEQIGSGLDAGIPAGLQTPLWLPAGGPTEAEVIEAATAQGLALEGLSEHWHDPAGRAQGVLIGFSRPTERAYPAAVALLAQVLRQVL